MSSIKFWATDVSVILIMTGIFLKMCTGKSEKNTIRFIVTLILIVTFFRFSVRDIRAEINYDLGDEINNEVSLAEEKLGGIISSAENEEMKKYISDCITEYDKNAEVGVFISESAISVSVQSENITEEEYSAISERLENEFECEIILRRGRLSDG